jgi:hypothetical protein
MVLPQGTTYLDCVHRHRMSFGFFFKAGPKKVGRNSTVGGTKYLEGPLENERSDGIN